MTTGNINKIILVGHLGVAPELRYTSKGNAVLNISLATNRIIKTADGNDRRETHWHKATLWGKRAENCAKYLVKGSHVLIEGELHMKSWTDKDGHQRKSAEIFVENLQFLSGMKNLNTEAPSEMLEAETPALAQ